MVDINSYFKSLKVSWVKRLLSPNIPNALTGFCVHLIPLILSLQFFSLPIHMPSVLFLFRINPENDPNIEEMKNQFTAWGKRNLTIMGKILIIKNSSCRNLPS
jgi:hypothetical protein